MLLRMRGTKYQDRIQAAIGVHLQQGQRKTFLSDPHATITLPHGSGKQVVVAAVAPDDLHAAIREAGGEAYSANDFVDLVRSESRLHFNVVLVTPAFLTQIGPLGRYLGPAGLMPNPRSGTVTPKIVEMTEAFRKGRMNVKMDQGGDFHVPIGNNDFSVEQLTENLAAAIEAIRAVKPTNLQGKFPTKASVARSQGPGIKVQI